MGNLGAKNGGNVNRNENLVRGKAKRLELPRPPISRPGYIFKRINAISSRYPKPDNHSDAIQIDINELCHWQERMTLGFGYTTSVLFWHEIRLCRGRPGPFLKLIAMEKKRDIEEIYSFLISIIIKIRISINKLNL